MSSALNALWRKSRPCNQQWGSTWCGRISLQGLGTAQHCVCIGNFFCIRNSKAVINTYTHMFLMDIFSVLPHLYVLWGDKNYSARSSTKPATRSGLFCLIPSLFSVSKPSFLCLFSKFLPSSSWFSKTFHHHMLLVLCTIFGFMCKTAYYSYWMLDLL